MKHVLAESKNKILIRGDFQLYIVLKKEREEFQIEEKKMVLTKNFDEKLDL
tara:strand:+ start:118 stop:270 length:153 start_codon:yes stop_codon:yes gene_type:complete